MEAKRVIRRSHLFDRPVYMESGDELTITIKIEAENFNALNGPAIIDGIDLELEFNKSNHGHMIDSVKGNWHFNITDGSDVDWQ